MGHKPTPKMISTPQQSVQEHCMKCDKLLNSVNDILDGKEVDLGSLRNACRCCKTGSTGIFKGDIALGLMTEIERTRRKRPVGKKKTRYKTHGKMVRQLREEGKSLREIARISCLAVNTIRDILKEDD